MQQESSLSITSFLKGTTVSIRISGDEDIGSYISAAIKKHKETFPRLKEDKQIVINSSSIVAVVNLTKLRLFRREGKMKSQCESGTFAWLVDADEWQIFSNFLNSKEKPMRHGRHIPIKYPSALSPQQLVEFVKDFCERNKVNFTQPIGLDARIVSSIISPIALTEEKSPDLNNVNLSPIEPCPSDDEFTPQSSRPVVNIMSKSAAEGSSDSAYLTKYLSKTNLNGASTAESPVIHSECGNGFEQKNSEKDMNSECHPLSDVDNPSLAVDVSLDFKTNENALDNALEIFSPNNDSNEIATINEASVSNMSYTGDAIITIGSVQVHISKSTDSAEDAGSDEIIVREENIQDEILEPNNSIISQSLSYEPYANQNIQHKEAPVAFIDPDLVSALKHQKEELDCAIGQIKQALETLNAATEQIAQKQLNIPDTSNEVTDIRSASPSSIQRRIKAKRNELRMRNKTVPGKVATSRLKSDSMKSPSKTSDDLLNKSDPFKMIEGEVKEFSDNGSQIDTFKEDELQVMLNETKTLPESSEDLETGIKPSTDIKTDVETSNGAPKVVIPPVVNYSCGEVSLKVETSEASVIRIPSPKPQRSPSPIMQRTFSRLLELGPDSVLLEDDKASPSRSAQFVQSLVTPRPSNVAVNRRRASTGHVPPKFAISVDGLDAGNSPSPQNRKGLLSNIARSEIMKDGAELSKSFQSISPVLNSSVNSKSPANDVFSDSNIIKEDARLQTTISITSVSPTSQSFQSDLSDEQDPFPSLDVSDEQSHRNHFDSKKKKSGEENHTDIGIKRRLVSPMKGSRRVELSNVHNDMTNHIDLESHNFLTPLPVAAIFYAPYLWSINLLAARKALDENRISKSKTLIEEEERKITVSRLLSRIIDIENRLLCPRYFWPGTLSGNLTKNCLPSSVVDNSAQHLFGSKSESSFSVRETDGVDDMLLLWSCFQLFGTVDTNLNAHAVTFLRLPQILNIFQASGLLPCRSAKSREAIEWISIELQKTRAVKEIRLRPNNFLNAFSMNDSVDDNTSVCDISLHLVTGADGEMTKSSDSIKTSNIIGSKSTLALKRDPIVKVSFPRFVKLIESLSINPKFQKAIFSKDKKRTQSGKKDYSEISNASVGQDLSKSPEKNSEISMNISNVERIRPEILLDPSGHHLTPTDIDGNQNLFCDVKDDVKRDLNVEETIDLQNKLVHVLLETHPNIPLDQKSQLFELLERKQSEVDLKSSKDTENEKTIYKSVTEERISEKNKREKNVSECYHQESDYLEINGSFLHYMVKKIKAVVSSVTIDQIYHRSNLLPFTNPEAQKNVFSQSVIDAEIDAGTFAENADKHSNISEISSGIMILRGGYLDDPEISYSGIIESFSGSAAQTLHNQRMLWALWDHNVIQFQQIFKYFASNYESPISQLNGTMRGVGMKSLRPLAMSFEDCRLCLHTFGIFPKFVDVTALTRLFHASKRWEWNVGLLYASGAVQSGSDVVNGSRKFPQENSDKPPFIPSGNLPISRSPIKSRDASDLNETYSSVKRKPIHEIVNTSIDEHGDNAAPTRDQISIRECTSTIGLTSLTFSGFMELLARISIAIFYPAIQKSNNNAAFDLKNFAAMKVCVNSTLRLMEESGGKEKLINCERKSVNIRNFLVKP